MRSLIFSMVLLALGMNALGAEPKYSCSELNEEMKAAAKAIVRADETYIMFKENGSIERKCVYAITILEEHADDLAVFYGPYDRYTRLKSVIGKIYGKEGKQEEVLKGDDILDISMIASYSLYDESRIKIIDPEFREYPYTIEYTYTYLQKSFLDIPDWHIYPDYNVSVQKALIQVIAPSDDAYRYLARNMEVEPLVEKTEDGISRTWKLEMQPALVAESMSPSLGDLVPSLWLGPTDFNYGGTEGNMDSWKEFGYWIQMLGADKTSLSPEEEAHILELVAGVDDLKQKVSILYRYMQDKVRYVYLALGIGGFEPIPAMKVSEAGYGDCKALSNYMRSILSVAGIPSWYTLVRAGSSHPKFLADFPAQQFNHAILSVPTAEDTIWLECTSQRLPAGYLGDFTDDRDVLLVTDEGGVLSRTPRFEPEDNLKTLRVSCVVDEYMDASIHYEKSHSGIYFGDMQALVNASDAEKQKRYVQKLLSISGFVVDGCSFEELPGSDPSMLLKADITATGLLSIEGEYVSLEAGKLSDDLFMPGRSRNRKYPVYRKRGYHNVDTVSYQLPSNLEVHSLPNPVSLDTDFGSYRVKMALENDRLIYTRSLLIRDGEFPAASFRDYYAFLRSVNSADKKKVLLLRK